MMLNAYIFRRNIIHMQSIHLPLSIGSHNISYILLTMGSRSRACNGRIWKRVLFSAQISIIGVLISNASPTMLDDFEVV